MKESITKFDLEAAFKALDEIDVPVAEKGVKANKPALTEIFSRKSKFDALFEEYYDIGTTDGLDNAKEAREAEVAKAKLARIEKIVDLDADSPEDLLTSYVGKYIMQCPQCMTLFYKDKEDIVESEDDPTTVNVNEVCQHCGNESGYTLIGKVGEAEPEEATDDTELEMTDGEDIPVDDESVEEPNEDGSEEDLADLDLGGDLEELDLDIEDDESEANESFNASSADAVSLTEDLTEDTELETSAEDFEKLINSPEFKKPITDGEARAMMDEFNEDEKVEEGLLDKVLDPLGIISEDAGKQNDELTESVNVNNETLKYAVINSDGTYAGVPCTSKEEARELAAQKEGRVIVELNETSEELEEGIFDKVKDKFADTIDKISSKLKSREAKADWVRENAMEDYGTVKVDNSGKLIPDEKNQRFHTFIVLGFTEKYSNGKLITMAPSFNNKDLVLGKNGKQIKKNYKDADNIAKGWSTQPGNGPAFVYLAKDENGTDAVFLCEYFKGELENDQLEKYFNVVKKAMKGAKLMAKGGMNQTEEESQSEEATSNEEATTEGLTTLMSGVEELQETALEKLISDSLVEAYGNVAGFRLTECSYLDEKLSVNGKVFFTSGNTRNISYTFNEAYTNEEGKAVLHGLNEKLGLDKQFVLTGDTKTLNKTFIAESFNFTRK